MPKKQELLPKILETGANELEIVDFRMYEKLDDGSIYEWALGVNVAKVKEVIFTPENVAKTPKSPPEVVGIAKIRDKNVPLLSLARWMKIKPAMEEKYTIVMEFLREIVGITIHEARRIRRLKWNEIKKPPESMNNKLGGKIVGVIEIENGKLLLLLDFEGILDELGMIKVMSVSNINKKKLGITADEHFKILIVDDSSVARRIMRKILTEDGHTVYEATNGIEALEMLHDWLKEAKDEGKELSDYVQLIISDIEMPGMDGLTFTKKVKENPELAKIPVIINTSLSDQANVSKSKFVGADAHLVKFDAPDLIKLVHKYALRRNDASS
ncbi:chemotaxis protein [Desulfurobacterium sp.]